MWIGSWATTTRRARTGGSSRDYRKGRTLLEVAVEKGHAAATQSLSVAYLLGNGVSRNAKKGVSLLETAVALGDDMAQCELAEYYEYGEQRAIIPQDRDKARKLYQLAAAQGGDHSIKAQSQLLMMDAGGKGFKYMEEPAFKALLQMRLDAREPEYQFVKAAGLLTKASGLSGAAPEFVEAVTFVACLSAFVFIANL